MIRRRNLMQDAGLLLLVALAATACSRSPSNPTVAASGTSCSYTGPEQVPIQVSLTWDVKPSTPSMDYGFLVVALTDGKTAADVTALASFDPDHPPAWMNKVGEDLLVSNIRTDTFNLNANATYQGEPLYVMCFSHGTLFGVVGPLEVSQ